MLRSDVFHLHTHSQICPVSYWNGIQCKQRSPHLPLSGFEICLPDWRFSMNMVACFLMLGGQLLMPVIAYLCHDWQVLQAVIISPLVLMLSYIWWAGTPASLLPHSRPINDPILHLIVPHQQTFGLQACLPPVDMWKLLNVAWARFLFLRLCCNERLFKDIPHLSS